MGASQNYNINLNINANAQSAERQLQNLQRQLQQIANMKVDVGVGNLTADIEQASQAAMKLSAHLATATNPQTGNLDFTKFYSSIQKSGASLEQYGAALQKMGPAGQKAFVSLADSISKSEIPLKRTSKIVDKMWDGLKRTAGWQVQSSIIHGIVGGVQQAVGYAKDLNRSLTDIRIVTGQSTDQMAKFAKEANKAAKNLSTTTTDYTRASLIYYQQGLSDAEVKARTETTIKMANATGTSAQKVSDQMTAIWNNYDNGTKSLTHYADVMTALGAATASSTDEIAQGLQKFASISNTVGLSYEYAASALATITAESRESADVVGNALKTLFSRIQGLQLGETLDDGTTLNKYSTALAKVGISIKDQAGGLKDMDDILDEMGTKWYTLARDEKMALAQTVAGVRQYTQLMTLMENWDDFKQNLNTAKTSDGALDKQAAIQAQSWEAASTRLRAAWEGLWDNLIESKGFITILNGMSELVNILDNMVTGLGGAGGALLTFGGALTRVFSKQITSGIQDAAYSISMMTKAGREKVSNERSNFLSSTMEGLNRDNINALGREYEYGARQSAIKQSLGLSYDYAKKGDKLSETQLLQYDMQKRALDELQSDSIKAAQDYDSALKARSDLYWKIANNDEIGSGLGSNSKAQLEAKLKENEFSIKYREDQIAKLGKGDKNKYVKKQLQREIDEVLKPAKKNLTAQLKELVDNNATLTSDILSMGRSTITQNDVVTKLQDRAAEAEQIANKILSDFETTDSQEFLSRDSSNNEKLKQAQEKYRQQINTQNQYLSSANRVKSSNVNQINNYSEALINQAKASNQFKINMQQAFENNDMAAFIAGLEEFNETSSNSMKGNGFLKTLTELQKDFNQDGSNVKDVISKQFGDQFLSGLEKFMASSMNKISGVIYDQLSVDDQIKFDSKEDFQQALRDAYSGVEITDTNRKQKAEQAKNLTEKMQQDLDKPYQESQSGVERFVKGAAATMEALAAGESFKTLWTSLADGTATLTSTLSGIASAALNASSAVTGFQSALTGLGGMSTATAGKIGLVITVLTALVSTAVELYDRATVSDKEHQQNLINSSNELNTFTDTTAEHLETVKVQNEDYLEGVKKIKSFDQDPTTLAMDIFESNKKALNLITEYGLTEDQYSTGANGLIEINEDTLKQYGEQSVEQANTLSEYANVFGQAKIDREQAENILQDFKDRNFADVSSLLAINNATLSDKGKDILRNALDVDQDGDLDSFSLSGEKISQMIADGTWDSMVEQSSLGASHFDDIKALGLDYDSAMKDRSWADLLYSSSLQVLSSKILQDAGYNSTNTDGYLVKSSMMSNLIQQQIEARGDWLNTNSTAILTHEQQEEAVKLIGSQLGVSNIKITGVDKSGQIKYQQGDDESTASTITRESLNSLYAMSKVMKDTSGLVSQVNTKYQDQINTYGKAGEVVTNLDIFNTALGANASAVKEFIKNTNDVQSAAMTDDQGNIIKKEDGSNLTAGDVFKDSGLKEQYERILNDENGIVSQLGLSPEVLDNVSMGTLDSLQKVMDVSPLSVKGLFKSITSIDNDPEKAAQLLTALSSMDFSSNDFLNASNLLGVLEDLGYNVSEGNLPTIYSWLLSITGLSPGSENFADTNSKISKNRGALNGIEPGGAVNTEAKEAAEGAGLRGNWVKSGEDEYTYTGTQDQIDAVKAFQNKAWAKNQANIDIAQQQYNNAKNNGMNLSTVGYNNTGDLANALGLNYQYNMDSQSYNYSGGNEQLKLLAEAMGLTEKEFLEKINANDSEFMNRVNSFLKNGSMSDETQSTEAGEFMSNITSAQDMMNAVSEAQQRGDKTGFIDENGIISDEALSRLNTFPATSERATSALDELTRLKKAYNKGEGDITENIVKEAQANYNLQQSIDAVAAARGIDAETIAAKLEHIKQESDLIGLSIQQQAELAARYVEVDAGLDELKANYNSLSQTLQTCNEGSNEWNKAVLSIKQSLSKISGLNINQISTAFVKAAWSSGLLERAINNDGEALFELNSELGLYSAIMDKVTDEGQKSVLQEAFETGGMDGMIAKLQEFDNVVDTEFVSAATSWNQTIEKFKTFSPDELLNNSVFQVQAQQWVKILGTTLGYAMNTLDGFSKAAQSAGFEMTTEPIGEADLEGIKNSTSGEIFWQSTGEHGEGKLIGSSDVIPEKVTSGSMQLYRLKFKPLDGGSGNSGGGGGGGGRKKVANKRKSQTVKRYKQNDFKRSNAQSVKKSASTQKDYLYGESKIAQMEKINKLAEKEARITSDRIKESRKYMIEDRENLIKYMQKYGYEAEFDSDGFLSNYEDAWTQIHDKIAKLYEDNELTADEQKLEEDYKIELEELEGALEDYENSLKELQSDIEAYEESLYEMYDNKVEQMQHKVEFKIELDEDDLSYLDFWIEALGDSLYNALEVLQTLGQKTNILFDGLDTYKQGIEDIYALSDDPLHTWATGGMDELLTQDQVDALRENRDGLMEYMQQLIDLRSTMQDKVLEVFDKWQEKLNSTMSTIEHYSSVLEHFKNIIDIVGKDSLGLNNQFMVNLEQNAINQSMDTIDATKAHYDAIVASNAEAQKNLEAAIASGDQARIEHWEGVVQSTTEAMQEAQDSLLSSLENTLTMIADQFESAMTRAVEAFNDAIYAHGGLQGLQDDYSSIREQSQLMAEDYQKIYELSKLNRNINKTLNDSNIIAGKQKMKSLQQEINELQASGVQLSQYDLEYLQAKYELRLAEIELENAQNNKDTVRLSKDSEGNWSYIYTSSVDKVDEAQQKYEDALYNMQNLSYEYMEEMSTTMMQTSLAMMEEIQALRIQDFDSYEAYSAEVQRIQDKYSAYLNNQQNELNKSVANNEELYNRDWQSYNATTGYKISANQDWADSYSETTLGALMDSESKTSDFANVIFNLSNMFTDELGTSAQNYFANAEMAMNKYGTSIKNFGTTATSTMTNISSKSKTAADDMKAMAQDMTNSFKDIADAVIDWQEEFSGQINSMLEEIGKLVESINDAIQKSAEMTSGKTNSGELIGTSDAIKLLNEKKELGKFEAGENGQIIVNGETYANWVEYNGKFIEAIDAKLAEYSQAPLGSEQRKQLAEELKGLFRRYHLFKEVVDRIYDPTSKSTLDLENPNYSSFDTGGYTGEWGKSGKFAMLHEKELILNSDDTENFLSALNVSRDIIHSIIEMNARQSSLALGNLVPSSIQDMSQNLEQQVSITAEFPNATNHSEIEEAFNNLINTASQYANRYPF